MSAAKGSVMRDLLTIATTALAAMLISTSAAAVDGDGGSAEVIVEAANTVDSDLDGLSDAVEALLGSSAKKMDTDNDGIDDGYEVAYGLNPSRRTDANEDFDGDNLNNKQEYAAGSNPFAMDSDNDGWHDDVEVARATNPSNPADKPAPSRNEDVDADGRVSAIDLQHTINAALGFQTSVPTNVNQVGNTDAIDIQLVILAALGL